MAIRDLKAQMKDVGERADRLGKGDALKKKAAAVSEKLTAVEEELINPEIKADEDDLNYEPKLDHDWTNLAGIVASADTRPTPGSVQYYGVLKAKLDGIVEQYKKLLAGDVAEFDKAVESAGVPRITAAPKIEK